MPTLLAAAFLFGQAVYAPPDVPKDHWAFSAVNEMFKEGLLKGYPADRKSALKVVKPLKYDQDQLEKLTKNWEKSGLLVGYPENSFRQRRSNRHPSNYEFAVAIHATCISVVETLTKPNHTFEQKRIAASEAESIVTAMSMLIREMKDLGVDVGQTVAQLDAAVQSRGVAFRG